MRAYGVPGFWRKADYVVQEAAFDYLGVRHVGTGLLTWTPTEGFHLELLQLKRSQKLPTPITFGGLRVVGPKDYSSIRLKLRDQGYAVTAPLPFDDGLGYQVVSDDRLSVDLRSVSFMHLPAPRPASEWWSGSALLDVGRLVDWPDAITQTTLLDGEHLSEGFSRSGLSYRSCSMTVIGRHEEGRHFSVSWSLDWRRYSRAENWRFPEALQDALRVMLSRPVWLLQREVDASPRRRLERRSPVKMQAAKFPLVESGFLNKERLFQLAGFFLKGGPEARIAQKIVSQMLRAARQVTWADEQLLLSTILEATLRACDRCPWPEKKSPIAASLSRFRQQYGLGSCWSVASRHAVAAFEHLRHPTAHPDWRLEEHDPARAADRSRALGEMAFLSRFYGYLILAMADVPDLKPIFDGRRVGPA